ncbi:MAG TPA: SDR family oxidoreductase [Candidatus Tetragenococcus pullicola]|nr:SDR family oxidoreductase [Candidatus Tetragenococcus pullicola]
MKKLENKVAVVTGGSSGIGLAIVKKFIAEGATAIVADVVPPKEELPFFEFDVTNVASIKQAVTDIVANYGKIDILVANAGVAEKKAPISELDEANWQKVIAIDLTGVVLTNKYVVAQMEKQKTPASVINMSSILGVVGSAKSQAYSAAKAGVINYTKSQAITYASKQIRFNAIAPGYVNTPLLKTLPKETTDSMVEKMPIGRLAEPEEIANVASFLASDEASIITGAVIAADGGYTAQ